MQETNQKNKNKLIITGCIGVILLIVIIVIGIFVFGSCGIDYTETDTNTVFVLEDGRVVSTDVEKFDQKTYDSEKLKTYLASVVDTYNKENGEDSLKQKTLTVEENVAMLVLEYADTKVYKEVNNVELFAGTIQEAKDAGYKFEETFAKMKGDKAVAASAEEFMSGEEYKVVIIKSNTKVVVPGDICFVSTQNVAKVGEDYVLIKDGAELISEEIDVNTEFGTEAEGSDGSITDDEMANTGDIIFDFGDEPNEESSQYSEVLTYIIYK